MTLVKRMRPHVRPWPQDSWPDVEGAQPSTGARVALSLVALANSGQSAYRTPFDHSRPGSVLYGEQKNLSRAPICEVDAQAVWRSAKICTTSGAVFFLRSSSFSRSIDSDWPITIQTSRSD